MPSTLITASGSWNWPTDLTSATVELIGGGGTGGAAEGSPSSTGGGKGGSYAKKAVTKGAEASLTVTIGAGGTAQTTGAGANGGFTEVSQGGTPIARAPGGNGSAAAVGASENGAAATGVNGTALGDTTFVGGNGGNGNSASLGGGGGGAAGPTANGGAASSNVAGAGNTGTFLNGTAYSGNGGSGTTTVGNPGQAPPKYGGAGAGGRASSATNRAGGNGIQGMCLITYTGVPHQTAFRFYNAGASIGSEIPLAAQDANYTANLSSGNLDLHIRFRLQNAVAVTCEIDDYQLRYSKNGGAYGLLSGAVIGYNDPFISEGAPVTTGLTGGTGSYVTGVCSIDGQADDVQLTASSHTELAYSVRLVAASLLNGDTLDFRVYRNGLALENYSITPRITVTMGGGGPTYNLDTVNGEQVENVATFNGQAMSGVGTINGTAVQI